MREIVHLQTGQVRFPPHPTNRSLIRYASVVTKSVCVEHSCALAATEFPVCQGPDSGRS